LFAFDMSMNLKWQIKLHDPVVGGMWRKVLAHNEKFYIVGKNDDHLAVQVLTVDGQLVSLHTDGTLILRLTHHMQLVFCETVSIALDLLSGKQQQAQVAKVSRFSISHLSI
jgi:hypothetical protein